MDVLIELVYFDEKSRRSYLQPFIFTSGLVWK